MLTTILMPSSNPDPCFSAATATGGHQADHLLTIAEAGKILRLSRSATYNVVGQGALKTVRIGSKSRRIRHSDLLAYIAGLQSVEVPKK